MLRIAVLISGGGTNLQAIIDSIEAGKITNARICTVISNNKNAYGLERAKKHGLDAQVISSGDFENRKEFNQALMEGIKKHEADLIVLAGFLVIIPEEMIKAYPFRIINVHPSLIPSFCGTGYYGLKVHEGVLRRGVKVTGATVHFVDAGTDTGPIILQKPVMVLEDDTADTLQKRVMEEAEWKLLPQAIDLIANDMLSIEGNHVFIK